MFLTRKPKPSLVLPQTRLVENLERRLFLRQSLSLGALVMLTGCDGTNDTAVDRALIKMSQLNDRVQAAIFDPNKLAPTYTEADITDPFPFNAYYGEDEAPDVAEADYKLKLSGLIANKTPWTLEQLRALPQESQITRHTCVEGWSAIGKWGGVRFSDFLARIGADTTAKYVGFKCADDYYQSIDMPTALHAQTIMALTFRDKVLPRAYGFPFKLRIPTKLGYKNPKYVVEIFVTNDYPGGFWEDQGYNWFGGA